MNRTEIYEALKKHYNDSEFKDLCFSLNIDVENLSGTTRNDKMRELVMLFERRERLPELVNILSPQASAPAAQPAAAPNYLEQAQQQATKGELEEAIQILLNGAPQNSPLKNSISQLSGRFHLYKKEAMSGMFSPADKRLQEANLLSSLLELIASARG